MKQLVFLSQVEMVEVFVFEENDEVILDLVSLIEKICQKEMNLKCVEFVQEVSFESFDVVEVFYEEDFHDVE